MDSERRTNQIWWLFAAALAVLCGALGSLQYMWIGEVSKAERERMQTSLRTSLERLSRDFNGELSAVCAALLPRGPAGEEADREAEYVSLYERWKENSPHPQLVQRLALAVPNDAGEVTVLMLDAAAAKFQPATWPAEWASTRDQLQMRLAGDGGGGRGGRGPRQSDDSPVFELPRFRGRPDSPPRDQLSGPAGPAGRPERPMEVEWLLVEFNQHYAGSTLIPELLRRHLGGGDYEAVVTQRNDQAKPLFQSSDQFTGDPADATIRLYDVQLDFVFRRAMGRGDGGGPFGRRGPPPWIGRGGPPPGFDRGGPDRGRWTLAVRHRSGSLEALVERGRWRNLAILGGLLLLMLAALGALVRYTDRERRLARLQMDFVAGVSHELRTPLSVIRTAAHNLHGGLVTHPKQIQRYGALIRDESERLTGIVEQVLRFAGAQAGRVIQAREPVRVEPLIEEALSATARLADEAGCLIERDFAPDLPLISADPLALKHALINLIANATKYGFSGGWIGVKASVDGDAVEITVQDRGPGIAPADQPYIFDAFYRGKSAIEDQIHGTGLGLNLVKRIAEAHDGTATVKSEPGVGTGFTLRIPTAPVQAREQDEFANTTD